MSNLSINYRSACDGSSRLTPTMYLGGCGQYIVPTNSATSSVPVYKNVTRMKTYLTTGPSYIPPYSEANINEPSCATYYGYSCPSRSTPNNTVFCGPISSSDLLTSVSSPTQSFSTGLGIYNNLAIITTASIKPSCGPTVGFKNAYSAKEWHGRHGYTSNVYQVDNHFNWCCSCRYRDYDSTPDTVKYLTINATTNRSSTTNTYVDIGGPDGTYCCSGTKPNYTHTWSLSSTNINTSHASNILSVDRYSGNIIVGTAISSSTGTANPSDAWNDMTNYANGNIVDLENYWCTVVSALCSPYPDVVDSNFNGVHHIKCYTTQSLMDNCGNLTGYAYPLVLDATLDINAGQLTLTQYSLNHASCGNTPDCSTCNLSYNDVITTIYSISNTVYSYSYNSDTHPSHSIETIVVNTTNGTLSNPYTSTDVYNDAVSLLAKIPLNDDVVLPWRTDNQTTTGPYVVYDESYSFPQAGYTTSITNNSGKIYGEPAIAYKGIDKIWMPQYNNYCVCTDTLGVQCAYINSYGAYNSDVGFGGCLTNITDAFYANSFPQGAFVSNRLLSTIPCSTGTSVGPNVSTRLFLGKWAEIIYDKKSFNYARPCGATDRFAVNSNSSSCISSIAGNVLTLSSPTKIQNNTYCYVGGTSRDGCYKVTVSDSTHIALTTQISSGSWLSTQPLANFGSGMILPLQFQDSVTGLLPAPICGYLNINTANQNNPVTMSVSSDHGFVNNDSVGIAYYNGNNDGYYTVSVIDNKTFALVGVDGTHFPTYNGKAIVYSAFGAAFGWNDTTPKGDFTTLDWIYDYRTYSEYLRLSGSNVTISGSVVCAPSGTPTTYCSAVPVIPEPYINQKHCYSQYISVISQSQQCTTTNNCAGNIVYCSPNNENYSGAKQLPWFSVTNIDSFYGTTFIKIIKQAMDDVYYIPPAVPCGASSWNQDDGTCYLNTSSGYPYKPQYESRASLPYNAPPIAKGYGNIGYIANTDNRISTDASCSLYNYQYPPIYNTDDIYANGNGCNTTVHHSYTTPWYYLKNQETCVCNTGSFSNIYGSKYGIGCNISYVAAP